MNSPRTLSHAVSYRARRDGRTRELRLVDDELEAGSLIGEFTHEWKKSNVDNEHSYGQGNHISLVGKAEIFHEKSLEWPKQVRSATNVY